MEHTYTPYPIDEMMRDSKIEMKLKQRIMHLVNVYALKIQAAKPGSDFVAYCGSHALTYKAVLLIHIKPGQSGGLAIAIEKENTPKDYMAKVVEVLTKYSYMTKDIA